MKKNRKVLKLLTSFSLVAAIAVGFTLAYLSSVTETKHNMFTSSSKVDGTLTEEDHWKDGWTDYKPGDSKAKTPIIELENGSEDAYVGMKVSIFNTTSGKDEKITLEEFTTKFATLTYNNGAENAFNLGEAGTKTWQEVTVDGNDKFYLYNEKLDTNTDTSEGASTVALFDKVKINTGIYTYYDTSKVTGTVWKVDANGNRTEITDNYVLVDEKTTIILVTKDKDDKDVETVVTDDTKLPSFRIDVQGYAVQTANLELETTAKTELLKLAGLTAK